MTHGCKRMSKKLFQRSSWNTLRFICIESFIKNLLNIHEKFAQSIFFFAIPHPLRIEILLAEQSRLIFAKNYFYFCLKQKRKKTVEESKVKSVERFFSTLFSFFHNFQYQDQGLQQLYIHFTLTDHCEKHKQPHSM